MDNLNKESNDCEVEATNDQVTVSQSKRKSISIRQIFFGEMQKYTHSQIIALNSLICALIVLFVVFPIKIGPLDLAVIPIVAIIICTRRPSIAPDRNGTVWKRDRMARDTAQRDTSGAHGHGTVWRGGAGREGAD